MTTKSGTQYYLGEPAEEFATLRASLLRQADADPTAALDSSAPLDGIDFGVVMPSAAAVKLPKVPGWRHDSPVALLHDWKAARRARAPPAPDEDPSSPAPLAARCHDRAAAAVSASRPSARRPLASRRRRTEKGYFACTGVAFNCPGAFDGAAGHTTADVIDVEGRKVKTVDGITYWLGRRLEDAGKPAGASDLDSPLGDLEDLLRV